MFCPLLSAALACLFIYDRTYMFISGLYTCQTTSVINASFQWTYVIQSLSRTTYTCRSWSWPDLESQFAIVDPVQSMLVLYVQSQLTCHCKKYNTNYSVRANVAILFFSNLALCSVSVMHCTWTLVSSPCRSSQNWKIQFVNENRPWHVCNLLSKVETTPPMTSLLHHQGHLHKVDWAHLKQRWFLWDIKMILYIWYAHSDNNNNHHK